MGSNVFPAPSTSTPPFPGTSSVIFEGMLTTAGQTTATKSVTIPAGDHIAYSGRASTVSFSDGQSISLTADTPKVVTLPNGASSVTFTLPTSLGSTFISASTTVITALSASSMTYYQPSPISSPTMAYTNGTFVHMGAGTTYYTSTDGITWTSRTAAFNGTYGIQGVNNLFFAFQASGTVPTTTFYTSPDGITWTSRTFPAAAAMGNIVYASTIGRYCVITSNSTSSYSAGQTYYSTDGFTWTAGTVLTSGQWANLSASPTRFVASKGYQLAGPSTTSVVAYSTTGTSFTEGSRINSTYSSYTLYSPDGYFYSTNAFVGGPERSTDGITWANASGGILTYMSSNGCYTYMLGKPATNTISGTTYYYVATSGTTSAISTNSGATWSNLSDTGTLSLPHAVTSTSIINFSNTATRRSTSFTPASFGLYAGPSTTV